jgi:hypothetical protein
VLRASLAVGGVSLGSLVAVAPADAASNFGGQYVSTN